MDVRRFVTETKAAVVAFLFDHLNSAEFTDLWASVGGGVDVSVARPGWQIAAELERPIVLLQKVAAETVFSNVAVSQYVAEGYWKDMTFELHACADDARGSGKIVVDDLASAIEVIFAQYAAELQALGILVWELVDAAEADDAAAYENVMTVKVRVLVPGATIEPARIEVGRFQMTAPNFGHFYVGTALDDAQELEAVLINGTSASEATLTVTARNQDNELCQLTLLVPRATAAETRLSLTGGDPNDRYKAVTAIAVTGGQAGYLVAIYNRIGG